MIQQNSACQPINNLREIKALNESTRLKTINYYDGLLTFSSLRKGYLSFSRLKFPNRKGINHFNINIFINCLILLTEHTWYVNESPTVHVNRWACY